MSARRPIKDISHAGTFDLQEQLPRLPIPDLRATLTKYLGTLEPLGSDVVARVKPLAESFEAGVGAQLHRLLIARDQTETYSWLERWWNAVAYYEYRESIVINVTYCYNFKSPKPSFYDATLPYSRQLQRAAALTLGFLQIRHALDTNTLPPETMKGTPQCMHAFRVIFNSLRLGLPKVDGYTTWPSSDAMHLVVARGGLFYSFSLIHSDGTLLTPLELLHCLQSVVDAEAAEAPATNATMERRVGVLTTNHRDDWAEARAHLMRCTHNQAIEDAIGRSPFLLSLDHEAPPSYDQRSELLLHGGTAAQSATNRWFDKPVHVVVFANAEAGLIGEHSAADGSPTSLISDWVLSREPQFAAAVTAAVSSASPVTATPAVTHFTWELDAQDRVNIRAAVARHEATVARLSLQNLLFGDYGREDIKQMRVSPDGWCQAALHLAFYRMHGCFTPCYESASTRQFRRGRTETGRTLTSSVVRFVHLMTDPSLAATLQQRRDALKRAAKDHITYMRSAVNAQGVDRHLLGLRLLAKEHGLQHPFLDDPALTTSSHWRLSTSQILISNFQITFGPVVPDGYGICYAVMPKGLNFSVTSWTDCAETDSPAFCAALRSALQDMRALFVGSQM